jgi:hypothetical protein
MHDDYEVSPRLKAWGAIAAVVLVLIGGMGYYASERAKTRERLRVEEARIAAAAAARQQAAEADERAAQEPVRGAHGAETRVGRSRRDRSGYGGYRSQDETDSYGRQYDDQPRASEDRASEEGERYQAEADRQRAQGDVDRQKRYVQQREEEEEAARNRRHDRVQQEERERAAGEAVPAPPDTSTPLDPRVRKK